MMPLAPRRRLSSRSQRRFLNYRNNETARSPIREGTSRCSCASGTGPHPASCIYLRKAKKIQFRLLSRYISRMPHGFLRLPSSRNSRKGTTSTPPVPKLTRLIIRTRSVFDLGVPRFSLRKLEKRRRRVVRGTFQRERKENDNVNGNGGNSKCVRLVLIDIID